MEVARRKITVMNAYTQQFHANDFPGYQTADTCIPDDERFWWYRDVPFVDIDAKLDLSQDVIYLSQNHHRHFTEMDSQINRRMQAEKENRLWYYTPHGHGWEQCISVGGSDIESRTILADTQKPDMTFTPNAHRGVLQNTVTQMESLGIVLKRLMIAALLPGGWVQPHIDPKETGVPDLAHFWIPINQSSPGLKIWPYGYLAAEVGHIYLFNNQRWTHSVVNRDQHVRYVALGLIDTQHTSRGFLDMAIRSAQIQWL